VVREWSPRVEYYSIDEFFFQAVGDGNPSFQELALTIRNRIWNQEGVPVTVGIARTRTLAKLISDAAKPFGALAMMDRAEEERLLAGRPVTEITGSRGDARPGLSLGIASSSTWRGPTAGFRSP
jgi:nucleotidyltransferase/DNA polymerase involved in DNA repair